MTDGASHPIILFDGVCNLCAASVQFIIKRDRAGAFKFASLQSEAGQRILARFNLPVDDLSSFILVEGDNYYSKSDAAIRVARRLGGFWRLSGASLALPKPGRDAIYSFIARRRYKWFGRAEACLMPGADIKARFLD
ncbi:MAG: thiol-disulfide oxidoreductase DCC family protein [Deltaproteobacteria bacterium]